MECCLTIFTSLSRSDSKNDYAKKDNALPLLFKELLENAFFALNQVNAMYINARNPQTHTIFIQVGFEF